MFCAVEVGALLFLLLLLLLMLLLMKLRSCGDIEIVCFTIMK